jgi:hypothetical protein
MRKTPYQIPVDANLALPKTICASLLNGLALVGIKPPAYITKVSKKCLGDFQESGYHMDQYTT